MSVQLLSKNRVHGGWLERHSHESSAVKGSMTFAIYLPPQVEEKPVPVLYWLSGLTCTDENFSQKAGAFRLAAELGLAIVMPDTSPRGSDHPGEHDSYDFGSAAGFYLNATQAPWSANYHMYDYVVSELPGLIEANFPVSELRSISGHSMGGHGAMTIALKNPERYRSVSAFSPICHPVDCPWGEKAFSGYLGEDRESWKAYDTVELMKRYQGPKLPLLVDQGAADDFLAEQLKPETLSRACADAEYPLVLRMHDGYDHSYYFISSFIEDHLRHHYKALSEG